MTARVLSRAESEALSDARRSDASGQYSPRPSSSGRMSRDSLAQGGSGGAEAGSMPPDPRSPYSTFPPAPLASPLAPPLARSLATPLPAPFSQPAIRPRPPIESVALPAGSNRRLWLAVGIVFGLLAALAILAIMWLQATPVAAP